MELKPGYKQTEVGVIPSDWGLEHVEDFAQITTGGKNTQNRSDDGSYPFFVRSQTIERINSYSFDGEAVLTAGDGVGTGKVFHYINGKFDVHQRVYRITDFADRVNGQFFFRYFSENFYARIMQMTAKSSVDSVRMEMIAKMQVPVPSRTEQDAIAAVIGDVDMLLVALDARIAKQRDLKTSVMQKLLTGKMRLPRFEGQWELKRLGEVLAVRHGKSQKEVEANQGKFPILATGGQIGWADKWLHNRPSVLIGRKGTIDRPQYMDMPFWTVDTLFYTELKGTNDAKFFFYRFGLIDWMQFNEASGVPSLNSRTIENIEITCPKPEEQTAIAEVLSDMDAQLAGLEQQRAKTALLKQGMMQELLTGRTRLVQPIASNVVPFAKQEPKGNERKANIHFQRSVFAAEIVERLHAEPTFGHVKFQKLIYLAERVCNVDIGANYHRDAAGPYDNRALRSIDSQLKQSKWFEAKKVDGRYQYAPLEKRGDHKQYFDRYFAEVSATFDKVIDTFKSFDTERCEIVATLYEAWHALLAKNATATDDVIVDQVLNYWHDAKKRIPEDRWRKALAWMREKSFVPEGAL